MRPGLWANSRGKKVPNSWLRLFRRERLNPGSGKPLNLFTIDLETFLRRRHRNRRSPKRDFPGPILEVFEPGLRPGASGMRNRMNPPSARSRLTEKAWRGGEGSEGNFSPGKCLVRFFEMEIYGFRFTPHAVENLKERPYINWIEKACFPTNFLRFWASKPRPGISSQFFWRRSS